MTDSLNMLIGSILISNIVLTQFLGLCPFFGVSSKKGSALGLGFATAFVLTLSATLSHVIYHYLLIPYSLEFLRLLAFILVIAVSVQVTEMLLQALSPLLHQVLGIYLPLITTNCAVLGVAILGIQADYSLFDTVLYAFGSALGFSLVLQLFANLRERIQVADVPKPFQGPAIALSTAGMMALAFMGFA